MTHGYLTPEEIPASFTRRWICVPNDPLIIAAVNGALLELTFPYNWELFGAITPEQMSAAMIDTVLPFMATESLCMPILHRPIILTDEKSQNTSGGTFSSGAWRTRTLNTKRGDTDEIVTLASNQFTVPAGIWLIKWRAPTGTVNKHQTLLYDITHSVGLAFGSSANASNQSSYSHGEISLQLASEYVMELRHQCQSTATTTGFGIAANFGTEVYTSVELYPIQ